MFPAKWKVPVSPCMTNLHSADHASTPDDEHECVEGQAAKVLPTPVLPTQEEIAAHEATCAIQVLVQVVLARSPA